MKNLNSFIIKFFKNLIFRFFIIDFAFDEQDDEYFNSYEHFNIYYQESKLRGMQNLNNNKEIWGAEESDLEIFKKHKMMEDQYLESQREVNPGDQDLENIYGIDEVLFNYKNRFKNDLSGNDHNINLNNMIQKNPNMEYNGKENIDDDNKEVYMDHLRNNKDINDNVDLNENMMIKYPYNLHKQTDFDKKRIAQGHPGMNTNNIYNLNSQFTKFGKEKRQQNVNNEYFNNYKKSNSNNPSYLSYINISIFGYTLYEYFVLIMIVIFAYFYFFSATFNDKFATNWYDANKIYFDRFNRVSVKPDIENIKNNTPMIKDAYNIYRYYSEEYQNIKWFSLILDFKNKQDTSSLISGMFMNVSDMIYYRVAINPIEPVPNVFCICNKNNLDTIKKSHEDVVIIF
jgi:hypothetical protein